MKAPTKQGSCVCETAARLQLKKHLPWCAALLLIVVVLFGKYLFSTTHVVSQYGTDIHMYYLYSQTFASAEISQGNLPVWNPYTYGGHPFLADFQSAMLYPVSWVLGLFNPVTAINWWVAIHVFLFGFLTYLWASFRGMRPGAAFVAAVAAMLGGTFYLHVYAGHVSNLGSMAWAPLVFLGIDGWIRNKHAGWIVAGAIGVALQVYAGHPQYVYYTAVIAGFYALVHLPYVGRQFTRTAIGLIALYPLALVLSAAQLLPGYCALSETVRSTGSTFEFASMFSLNPENFFTLFAPWIYGGDDKLSYWGRCYLWEMQLFFGICMMMLAVYGFAGLRRADRWRMALVLGLIVILALGAYTPLYIVLYKYVPFYGAFRGTSKFIYLFGLFAALLAGYGINRLLTEGKRTIRFGIACLSVACVVLVTGVLIKTGALASVWQSVFDALTTSKETYFLRANALAQIPTFLDMARALTGSTLITNGLWLLVFGILVLGVQYQRRLVWGVGACAVINLAIFAWTSTSGFDASQAMLLPPAKLEKENPTAYIEKLPFIARVLKQNPGDYRSLNLAMSSANMAWRADGLWGYDPSVLKRYAEYMYFSQGVSLDRVSQEPPFRQKSPMPDMLRCRVAFMPDGKVIEMGEPYSRFMIISQYRVIKDRDSILQAIANPQFKGKQEVILESEPIPAPEKETVNYSVKLLGATSDSWTLEVNCDKATMLVMTDAYAKGWTATTELGSVQTNYNVMPANYAMRAIPLAQGRHIFKLEYKQPGLGLGVKMSLAATLLLGVFFAFGGLRRKLDFSVKEAAVHASESDHDIEAIKCAITLFSVDRRRG